MGLALLPLWAHAQVASAADIAALKQAVADAKNSADNSWMLVSSALVLMMTGPGLALFYSGLVRKKNVLGTMMQSFILSVDALQWTPGDNKDTMLGRALTYLVLYLGI